MENESVTRFLCDNDALSRLLNAALKVAGKKELEAVRLRRHENSLIISAVNPTATFVAEMAADWIEFDEDRDGVVEISKVAANSLASFKIQMPKGLAVEQTVSISIGEERIRLQDETGLWKIPGGRDEHRRSDLELGGDHLKSVTRAGEMEPTQLFIGPNQMHLATAVVRALHKPVTKFQRSEPAPGVSRWLVAGPGWALTMTSEPSSDTANSDSREDSGDTEPEALATVHVVTASPSGGIA